MGESVNLAVIVSSWPFRLGTIVSEPNTGASLFEWDLADLREQSDWTGIRETWGALYNPTLAYEQRANALLRAVSASQEYIRDRLAIDPDDPTELNLVLSQEYVDGLRAFAEARGLKLKLLTLGRLGSLTEWLEGLPEAEHHAFCADWLATFHPASDDGTFRALAGPGGSLYRRVYGDLAQAAWEADQREDLSSFSLWTVLNAHWGWRLEFSDQPAPRFASVAAVREMFRATA
jgi:hypothetical protein